MNGLYILAVFLLTLVPLGQSSEWSYTAPETDPKNWYKIAKTCKGAKQSPIALSYSDSIHDSTLKPISIYKNRTLKPEEKFSIVNNGHSIEVSFPENYFFLKLGDPEVDFSLVKMHFHWGNTSSEGSEHSINGKKFPVEMHLVTYNTMYFTNLSAALGSVDGLAVLGVMFTEDAKVKIEDTLLYKMSNFLKNSCSMTVGENATLEPFSEKVFLELNYGFSHYYRYQGSLTTPPCTEDVYWTLLSKPVPVHPDQLKAFRCLKFGESDNKKQMVNNFRPIQTLNSDLTVVPRTVYRSWNAASTLGCAAVLPAILSFLLVTF